MKITHVESRAYHLPLKERMVSAKFALTHRELVTLTVETDAGITGVGWYTTPGVGALAAKALLDLYMAPFLIGEDPRNNEKIWDRLWTDCHYAGPGGLTTLALSAIDIALWDIKGKLFGEPLHRLLGGHRTTAPVYASAINLHLTKEQLLEQTEGHLQAGYSAFKLKVGKNDLDEDIDRCRAVRALIGPGRALLLDSNQKWKSGEAAQRCQGLEEVRPGFIEEPLSSDDVAGHAHLRASTTIPIAFGEQLTNRFEFWNYVKADAVDYLQPCPWKVGGITEWMRIAAMAQCANLTISPHGAMELCQHLTAAIPNGSAVENIFGVSLYELGASAEPVPVKNGAIQLSEKPGHGIVFDGPGLGAFEVKDASKIKREATTHSGF